MPWITTKTGKHINTDWLEEEKTKNKQIAESKKQAKVNQDKEKAKDNDKLYRKLKDEGYRTFRGTMHKSGEPVIMVNSGCMADGSSTYVRGDTIDKQVYGLESDGYIRQYQKDRRNVFYLMTEDKSYY